MTGGGGGGKVRWWWSSSWWYFVGLSDGEQEDYSMHGHGMDRARW